MTGLYVDRQVNPVQKQGGVFAGADEDLGARLTIQAENKQFPSLYGGAEDESVWRIVPDELLFSVPSKHGSGATTKLSVLGALNGLGQEATVLYPTKPAMVREAVKAQIQYIGTAYQALDVAGGESNLGITVQLAGLKTLRMGHGEGPNYIKPGDLVCAEVPLPGRMFGSPFGNLGQGIPQNKTTLQLRRCSTRTAAESLRMHILEILEDPLRWKMAMGERLLGTAMWATAAHEVMNSYLVGGLIFVREVIATGLLKPTAGASDFIEGAAKLADEIGNGDFADNSIERAGVDEYSYEFVAHLAGIVGLLVDRNQKSPAGAHNMTNRVRGLRANTLPRIFHSAERPEFEFGHRVDATKKKHTYAARVTDNKQYVDEHSNVGKMLTLQLNHFTRGVSGMHQAILNDLRFIVGKAATGASAQGSGKVHVMQGIARQ